MTSSHADPLADDRLRALLDLSVSGARTLGLSAYDGRVQDLSPAGVRAGLARLGGPARPDPVDEPLLSTAEAGARYELGELEVHRWNPAPHVANLDLSDYDRPGIEPDRRAALRRAHLAAWPDAVDAALAALDAVPATVATALLPSAQALTADLEPHERDDAALATHQRFVDRLRWLAAHSEAEAALGSAALARWLSVTERADVDLGDLAARADAEIARLRGMLDDAAGALDPGRPTADVVMALRADFPGADEVLDEARAVTGEVRALPRDPAGPVVVAGRPRRLAGGVQPRLVAGHHRARGRARPFHAFPGAARRGRTGAQGVPVRRLHRRMGPRHGGAAARGGIPRRGPALSGRGGPRGPHPRGAAGGRYTWGKLAIRALRDRARREWGAA